LERYGRGFLSNIVYILQLFCRKDIASRIRPAILSCNGPQAREPEVFVMTRIAISMAALALAAGLSATGAKATPCAASDLSLTIGATTYTPVKCADNLNQGSGPLAEATAMVSALAVPALSGGFAYLASSGQSSPGTGLGGVRFTVTADEANSGSWHLTWTDQAGLPNLPLTLDLEVGLFGGNNGAGYLLTNVFLPLIPNTGYGTFDINFLNHGGHQPELSHLILAGGNYYTPAPEPASLAILSAGAFALGWVRRRRPSAIG
jgi:hypothetical protein